MPKHFPVSGSAWPAPRSAASATIGALHQNSSTRAAFHNNHTNSTVTGGAVDLIQDVAVYRCQHWRAQLMVWHSSSHSHRHPWRRYGHLIPVGVPYFDTSCCGAGLAAFSLGWQVDHMDKVLSRRFLTANLAVYAPLSIGRSISLSSVFDLSELAWCSNCPVCRNSAAHFVLRRESAEENRGADERPVAQRSPAEEP